MTNNEIAKEFRIERSLTQKQFADLLKVKTTTIISWERPISDKSHNRVTNQTIKMLEIIEKLEKITSNHTTKSSSTDNT